MRMHSAKMMRQKTVMPRQLLAMMMTKMTLCPMMLITAKMKTYLNRFSSINLMLPKRPNINCLMYKSIDSILFISTINCFKHYIVIYNRLPGVIVKRSLHDEVYWYKIGVAGGILENSYRRADLRIELNCTPAQIGIPDIVQMLLQNSESVLCSSCAFAFCFDSALNTFLYRFY